MRVLCFLSILSLITLSAITGCASPYSSANPVYSKKIQLDPLFTDHMVLQRNLPIKVRGWSEPGSKVKVSLASSYTEATTSPEGIWIAKLPAMQAGGPYEIIIEGAEVKKVIKDVLIGDVWICSGQSNMEWPVRSSANAEEEIKNANHSNIRLFTVHRKTSYIPLNELLSSSTWQKCSSETIERFSAVGYYFGRELNQKLDIPIGLINTSWGGTVAEAWTSLQMLRTLPSFKGRIKRLPKCDANWLKEQKKKIAEIKKLDAIRKKEIAQIHKIEADKQFAQKMSAPTLDDSKWKKMIKPSPWEKAGLEGFDGVVVFRKTIDIPKSWSGKELKLALGPIDEVDTTYFNGHKVGGMGSVKKNITKYWNQPRLYTVPGSLVKGGKNVITCIVYDLVGEGGLWGGKAEKMKVYPSVSPKNSISLAGEWKYQPGSKVTSLPKRLRRRMQNNPSFLFNAMISPLLNFPISGAIWYQGESNAGRAYQYRRLFPAMIQDWRIRWQQGDFPFYFVQLANFMARKNYPEQSTWAELREAQSMALRLPNTGMAVIIDIGEAKDIHPKNKQDVGKRLAQNALAKHYKNIVIPAGPLYKSVKFTGGKAIISFNNVGKGLIAKNGTLKGFAIAGKDKKFVWANAQIEGSKVIVWNDKIKQPVSVRYAWANNPACNLYNQEGFPASPFRTDDWPGVTLKKK